jgi:NADPH:quinone reductase
VSDQSPVRAVRLLAHGAPLAVEEVALPAAGDGEVRVELDYGGVNPVDRYGAIGRVAPDGPLPRTLGAEAGGTLDGRPVLVAGEGLGAVRDGVWASAAVVPRESIVELPDGVSTREAAAMGIAGLTALNCVRRLGRVTDEDRVLVLGASGGVGSMIVSLCAAAGATVWGQTGSADKAAGIERQGAQRAVVGGPDAFAPALADLKPTVAFDPLGDGFVAPVIDAIEPHGRVVSFGVSAGAETTFNIQALYRKGVSLLGYAGLLITREQRIPGLREALAALADGSLRVVIDEALPIDRANDAFARLVDRGVQGKLLLDLRS